MDQSPFPLTILLFYAIRYLAKLNDKGLPPKEPVEQENITTHPNEIQYLCNGFPVVGPHFIYYIKKLDIEDRWGEIDDDLIMNTAKGKVSQLMDTKSFANEEFQDIMAARNYLLDMYNYMVWRN